jgi:hypothetical protein
MQTSPLPWCAVTFVLACAAQAPEEEPSGGLDPLGAAGASPSGDADAAGGSGAEPSVIAAPEVGAGASGDGSTGPSGPSRPAADPAGVRYAGGETSDFGNGSTDVCGTVDELEAISREAAEALGFDVVSEVAWLGEPHRAASSWNPSSCDALAAFCADDVELSVEVTDFLLVHRSYRNPGGDGGLCPSGPTEHLAYRGAVHVETDDGQLAGTFYARLLPVGGGGAERDRFVASAIPDLRNFSGSLPLRLALDRAHVASMFVDFDLSRDGSTSGSLEPSVRYYDAEGGRAVIGASASWGEAPVVAEGPVPSGAATTLSDYPGSSLPPLVTLSVTADSVDRSVAVDVDVAVSIGDQLVARSTVPGGTSIELEAQPFGTRVSVDVRNLSSAGTIRANIVQNDCVVASSDCTGVDCTAHAEHTTGLDVCRAP